MGALQFVAETNPKPLEIGTDSLKYASIFTTYNGNGRGVPNAHDHRVSTSTSESTSVFQLLRHNYDSLAFSHDN